MGHVFKSHRVQGIILLISSQSLKKQYNQQTWLAPESRHIKILWDSQSLQHMSRSKAIEKECGIFCKSLLLFKLNLVQTFSDHNGTKTEVRSSDVFQHSKLISDSNNIDNNCANDDADANTDVWSNAGDGNVRIDCYVKNSLTRNCSLNGKFS